MFDVRRRFNLTIQAKRRAFYIVVFFMSTIISGGGIIYAILVSRDASDAGRGGAIVDGIVLFLFLWNRNYADDVYKALTEHPEKRERIFFDMDRIWGHLSGVDAARHEAAPKNISLLELEKKFKNFTKRIERTASAQRDQNMCLAFSTGVGTFAWGFGDVIANKFIAKASCEHIILNLHNILSVCL